MERGLSDVLPPFQGITIVLGLCVVLLISILQERGVRLSERFAAFPLPLRWLTLLAAIFSILLLGSYGTAYDAGLFIYARF